MLSFHREEEGYTKGTVFENIGMKPHYVQYENSQTAKMSLIALEGLNKIVSLIEFFLNAIKTI